MPDLTTSVFKQLRKDKRFNDMTDDELKQSIAQHLKFASELLEMNISDINAMSKQTYSKELH